MTTLYTQKETLLDKFRLLAEDCDGMQGVQVHADANTGYLGVTMKMLEALREEDYTRTPVSKLQTFEFNYQYAALVQAHNSSARTHCTYTHTHLRADNCVRSPSLGATKTAAVPTPTIYPMVALCCRLCFVCLVRARVQA